MLGDASSVVALGCETKVSLNSLSHTGLGVSASSVAGNVGVLTTANPAKDSARLVGSWDFQRWDWNIGPHLY